MCRHLLRVLISVLTFTIGVAISPIRFTTEMWGHGVVSDGGGAFAVVRYRSSYFVNLWRTSEVYDTPEKADQVFQDRLREAVRVLERTPKFSGGGAKVGERAVAIFYSRERGEQYACVFWTEGRVLTQVYSSSLMHVLDFEKHQGDY
jgi:hypothetical protein